MVENLSIWDDSFRISILCPVSAYKRMCKKVKAKKNDPLFTLPDKTCITSRKCQNKLRQIISDLNLDPKCYSTHGLGVAELHGLFNQMYPLN